MTLLLALALWAGLSVLFCGSVAALSLLARARGYLIGTPDDWELGQ